MCARLVPFFTELAKRHRLATNYLKSPSQATHQDTKYQSRRMEVEQRFVPTGSKRRYQFPALVAIDKALFGTQALDWAFPQPLQSALQSVLHPEQEDHPAAKAAASAEPTFSFEAKRAYEAFLAEWPQLHQAWIEETRQQAVQSDTKTPMTASAHYTHESKPSTPHLLLRKGKDPLPLLGLTPQRSASAASVDEADASLNKQEKLKSGVPAQWTEVSILMVLLSAKKC